MFYSGRNPAHSSFNPPCSNFLQLEQPHQFPQSKSKPKRKPKPKKMNNSNNEASNTPAPPQPDRWYNLTLGSSFKDDHSSSSNKFCTLRYEFKPASIDKDQRGYLHKSKDNKVTVEFQNNIPGKPKVVFEGSTEDYKETDAVLFFDGESIRLERLHRAVKRLRHNRAQGESNVDASSPPVGKGNSKHPVVNKDKDAFIPLPGEVERIEIGDFKSSDAKSKNERTVEYHATQANSPNPSPDLLDLVNNNSDDDDDDDAMAAPVEVREYETGNVEVREFETGGYELTEHETGNVEIKEYDTGIDINIPHQADSDDEIADVDVSDGDDADNGPNAAEALKMTLTEKQSSSSSDSSSGSGSSGSSSSSSSDSESSDANTVNSI